MTKVININQEKESFTYIGRAGKTLDGYFGNPFPMRSKENRAEVLKQYKAYLWHRVNTDKEFRTRLWALKGHTLGCFCKPHACHGDIIVAWIEAGGPYKVDGQLRYMEHR